MKKILLTTICLAFATFSFSQQLSRYVVSSGGNYSSNSGYTISSTIGEPMVTTLTSGSNVLTQGFQQSFSAPIDPTITIINPLDGDIFPNNNNIGIDFSITDFVVAAGTGDGHIHYYVNSAMTMKYDTLPITLNGLANGSHQIIIELVDNSHQAFSPTIADTVNFSVNVISGCTDSTALNYDPLANTDDSSCTYPIYGCTGSTYCNYDSTATMDDGSCWGMSGCTDSLATNYDPIANCDDGLCTYQTVCSKPVPTGLYVDNIIHSQAQVHWDNMSDPLCMALKYFIQVRELGTTSWTNKLASDAGLCNFGLPTTSKMFTQLASNTTYEYRMKAAYCNTTGTSSWTSLHTFTTASDCPNVTNFTATPGPQTNKVVFSWDTTSSYSFVRVKLRVDSISAPTGSDWFSAGGFGVNFPALSVNKWGVVPGETYRGQARTWCNPNAGLYRSAAWTPLVFWTQPTSIRVETSVSINNLEIYPNPSRDIFNLSFTSQSKQSIEVRVMNLIGEVIFTENLENFEGEYSHSFNLSEYSKGVYLLELDTDNGIVNKKLILQ